MSQNKPDYENYNVGKLYNPNNKRKLRARNHGNHRYTHPYNNYQYYNMPYSFQPRWGYWRKRPPSHKFHKTLEKQPPRSPSPFSGTEEYTLKKIQEASDMIKKRLMMPESEDIVNTPKTPPGNNETESEHEKRSSKSDNEKSTGKTNKKISQYNVGEIHNKIISHITNLSHGKKVNLICANSSGYDVAIQQIHKQKRLELSKVLRDMCSNQTVENSDVINSIIPDIGIKIEDLPLEVIQELSTTLDLNFDDESFMQYSYEGVKNEICENGDEISQIPVIPENNEENIDVNGLTNIKQEAADVCEAQMQHDICETQTKHDVCEIQTNHDVCDAIEKFPLEIKQESIDIFDTEMKNENVCQFDMEISHNDNALDSVDSMVGIKIKEELQPNNCCCENDVEKLMSVGIQTDLLNLNSVSIQTDNNSDRYQFQIEKENVKSLDDAITIMLKIDKEVMRLTELRQSIFAQLQKKQTKNQKEIQKNSPSKKSRTNEDILAKKEDKSKNCPNKKKCDLEIDIDVSYEKVLNFGIAEKILVMKVIEDTLLAASDKGNIYYISTSDGATLNTLRVSSVPITSLCLMTTKKKQIHLLVGSLDTKLREFNLKTRQAMRSVKLKDCVQCMELAWEYVFVGTVTGNLIRYSLKQSKVEFEEKISQDSVMVLKATQEGARRVLLVGMRNETVCVRDAMSGLYLRTMTEWVTPTVYSLVLENSMVYCGTKFHDILVFSFHDGTLVHKHEATNSKGISCMKVAGNLLFASCYNGNIYVYNIKSHKYVGAIEGPGGIILSLEIVKNLVIIGTSLNLKSVLIPEDMLEQNKI